MKSLIRPSVAMVLLVVLSGVALAQQQARGNVPAVQGDQHGQLSADAPQQNPQANGANAQGAQGGQQLNTTFVPSGNLPYVTNFLNSNQSNDGQPSQNSAMNVQWMLTGNNGVWANLTSVNADVNLTPADDALCAHLKLPKDQGLVVTGLAANSPPALVGIEPNDVLLELAGAPLSKTESLESTLKSVGEGPVPLTILRGGKRRTIQVQPMVRVTMGPVQPEPPAYWLGVSVSPLEPALRAQLKLQNRGLLAIDVIKDSPAAQAEVKVHDILVNLDGKMLESQEKLVELVQSIGEKPIPLELIREGKTQTVTVTPRHRKQSQQKSWVSNMTYDFVRPGAVFAYTPQPNNTFLFDANNGGGGGFTGNFLVDPSGGQTGAPAVAKRLDDLDTEIKQLHKAIEELSKILKDKR